MWIYKIEKNAIVRRVCSEHKPLLFFNLVLLDYHTGKYEIPTSYKTAYLCQHLQQKNQILISPGKWCFYLICSLFNGAFSVTKILVSNERVTGE
jgi:hypothetical protein